MPVSKGRIPHRGRQTEPRILIVDDAPIVLDTFRLLLEGREIETAATVAEADAKLKADNRLKIVIADLSMRDGGIPFLSALRTRYPDRVLIVLSGDASVLGEEKARDLGIFRCLEKGQASFDEIEAAIAEASESLRRPAG